MIKILDAKLRFQRPHSMIFKEDAKSELLLLVNKYPHFVYKKLDNLYYAKDNGFVSAFMNVPDRNDGFGGRTITLDMVDGAQEKFYGSLFSVPGNYGNLDAVSCSITNSKKSFDRGYTFIACLIHNELCKEIKKRFKII